MAERLNRIPERELSPADLAERAKERREQLKEQVERKAEQSHETDVEQAKQEALEKATAHEKEVQEKAVSPAEKRTKRVARTKASLDKSFNTQMKEAQAAMSAPSRAFSKVIHNKAVEKTSEAIDSTIARPNAMLSGALFALILTSALYFWAKWAGYPLSGFETIGAFIIGWLIGIIFDFTRIMVTGKR